MRSLFSIVFLAALATIWGGLTAPSLTADDLHWAEERLDPQEQAPQGLRNNLSLEMLNAVEGLFELRFQHYFRDSLAYYLQLQVGSHLASGLNFLEEFKGRPYKRLQLGFALGLSSLLYARNSKVTKDIRLWGSGLIMALGARFMFSNVSDAIQDNILSAGLNSQLGWQLQARNFSVSLYLQLRLMLHFSTQNNVDETFPIIVGRGALSRALPSVPMLNSSQASRLADSTFHTFSQTLNLRVSYYF